MLTPMAGVYSFRSLVYFRLCPQNLFFLSFISFFLTGFTALLRNEAVFESLGLSFLKQEESLLLDLWVYIFEKVL